MDRYEFPNRKGAVPLRGLPYSEASTICRKKGKKIPTISNFMQACMGPNNNTHPYGNEFVPGKCRTGLTWPEGPAPAGSYPECVSDPGVYDMSGNLWEWLYTKRGNPPIAGGAWNSVAGKTGCKARMGLFRKVHSPNIGFRCVLYPNKKENKKRGNKKPGGR